MVKPIKFKQQSAIEPEPQTLINLDRQLPHCASNSNILEPDKTIAKPKSVKELAQNFQHVIISKDMKPLPPKTEKVDELNLFADTTYLLKTSNKLSRNIVKTPPSRAIYGYKGENEEKSENPNIIQNISQTDASETLKTQETQKIKTKTEKSEKKSKIKEKREEKSTKAETKADPHGNKTAALEDSKKDESLTITQEEENKEQKHSNDSKTKKINESRVSDPKGPLSVEFNNETSRTRLRSSTQNSPQLILKDLNTDCKKEVKSLKENSRISQKSNKSTNTRELIAEYEMKNKVMGRKGNSNHVSFEEDSFKENDDNCSSKQIQMDEDKKNKSEVSQNTSVSYTESISEVEHFHYLNAEEINKKHDITHSGSLNESRGSSITSTSFSKKQFSLDESKNKKHNFKGVMSQIKQHLPSRNSLDFFKKIPNLANKFRKSPDS